MAKVFININGEERNAASLTFPGTGREFRGAWQFNGDVIEVDMVKAKEIKIDKIVSKAQERVQKAEEKALKKALKGEDTTVEDAEIAKFKSKPKADGIAMIQNAPTPEALNAITEDEVFS